MRLAPAPLEVRVSLVTQEARMLDHETRRRVVREELSTISLGRLGDPNPLTVQADRALTHKPVKAQAGHMEYIALRQCLNWCAGLADFIVNADPPRSLNHAHRHARRMYWP